MIDAVPPGVWLLVFVVAVILSTFALIVRGVSAGARVDAEQERRRAERRTLGPLPGLAIRPLVPTDRAAWEPLWSSYCAFYGEDLPSHTTETTWKRLVDPESPVKGWGAFDAGRLVGFAHTVLHQHTWSPKWLCYLEDLFVIPEVRGRDVGFSIISFLWAHAESEGWGRLYWHTETTNAAARRLYDRFRPADGYVRYTLTL